MKKSDINLKPLQLASKKLLGVVSGRIAFIVIIAVLLVYLGVVWRISGLAAAEPPADAPQPVGTDIPRIDKKSIEQITKLEESSSEVRSLFNEARNNPFQE